MKTVFLSLLTCVGAVVCLRADPVIQFDDLSSSLTQVPSGYHQLKYTNVFLMNGLAPIRLIPAGSRRELSRAAT